MKANQGLWLLALAGGAFLWLPWLGAVHLFDWDEINFAEISREMVISGRYLQPTINFQPFWEKPPLFFWLQALSFHVFGINEWAARFPNALCGMITLAWMVRVLPQAGKLWALLYAGSLLPHFYFRSGLIDPWYNLLGFWMFWYGLRTLDTHNRAAALKAGISGGLALLTKGPAVPGLVGLSLAVYALSYRRFSFLRSGAFLMFTIVFLVTGASWYVIYLMAYGPDVMGDFLLYQWRLFSTPDAGHSGFPGYHLAVLFLGVMPASAFCLATLKHWRKADIFPALTLTVLTILVFSVVKTKIVHYSSLAYFPITYLAAQAFTLNDTLPGWSRYSAAAQWILLALCLCGAGWFVLQPHRIMPFIKDPFIHAALSDASLNLRWPLVIAIITACCAGVLFMRSGTGRHVQKGLVFSTLAIAMAIYGLVGEVEKITQRPLIQFCKEAAKKRLPVYTEGFKSYAPYFYGKVQPPGWAGPDGNAAAGQSFVEIFKLKAPSGSDCKNLKKQGAYLLCVKTFAEH